MLFSLAKNSVFDQCNTDHCPPNMLLQWASEICKHCHPGLRVISSNLKMHCPVQLHLHHVMMYVSLSFIHMIAYFFLDHSPKSCQYVLPQDTEITDLD